MFCQNQSCQLPSLATDDLFDLFFAFNNEITGHLCVVYFSYIDDSKDKTQQVVFVTAGFFADRDHWAPFCADWRKVLAKHGIAYYKTSECKMLVGEFEKFKAIPKPGGREAANSVEQELREVAKRHPFVQGVAVAVNVADYQKVLQRPEAKSVFGGNPYHRALEHMFLDIANIIAGFDRNGVIAFVHDEGPDFIENYQLYTSFKSKNKKTAKRLTGFSALSDKTQPELQLADMFANNTQERIVDLLRNGTPIRKEDFHMHENLLKAGMWDEKFLLAVLKHNLEKKGLPIPADLR